MVYLVGPHIQIYHLVFAKLLSYAFFPFDGDEKTFRQTSEFIEVSRACYEDQATRVRSMRVHLASPVPVSPAVIAHAHPPQGVKVTDLPI